ncbi:MAG: hypothetical protein J5634_04275 [Bacilli bacterium]|nr:hypothetical protein [Bacilli bacterium]
MEIKSIIKKYKYNKELSSFLKRLYPLLVDFFKDENLIYNALDNCEIIMCGDISEYARKDPSLYESLSLSDNIDLCGVYVSEPFVKYDKKSRTFKVDYIDRSILINGSDLYYDEVKAVLVHEICHLIKSYNHEFEVRNDVLTHRSGFLRTISIIKKEEGYCSDESSFSNGMGLEEGLNVYTEKLLCEKLGIYREVEDEYLIVYEMAKSLMMFPSENIQDIIIKAQIYHDNTLIDKKLGIGFYKLQDFSDEVYFKTFELINNASNYDEKNHIFKEMCEYVEANYKGIIESMHSHARKRSNINARDARSSNS